MEYFVWRVYAEIDDCADFDTCFFAGIAERRVDFDYARSLVDRGDIEFARLESGRLEKIGAETERKCGVPFVSHGERYDAVDAEAVVGCRGYVCTESVHDVFAKPEVAVTEVYVICDALAARNSGGSTERADILFLRLRCKERRFKSVWLTNEI